MMFTIDCDSAYNSPCHGFEASSSSDYPTFSSTALCASAYTFFEKGLAVDSINYIAEDRSKAIASRLVQLCDSFDRDFFQADSNTSPMPWLLWRWFF
ncbi:hypothetical protein Y032_0172g346 [Ancylostoma ceylanicum]|uniref:Uncharacterized protein n=1 Tax=Ancylostoma ceylanicum TaxID=53326 RepID=A0A016SUF0_9BILA|nr:hypothetical protein Y032_0172g346 [Ancylostoma ceylanicum]